MGPSIYRVLVLGDFYFGESYSSGGRRVIRDHGYGFSTKHLKPFIETADRSVLNLETPLARKHDHVSNFNKSKAYVHWADPLGSAQALADLGVDAVGLANNHTLDLGGEALEATLEVLSQFGISAFGAGSNRQAAERPYCIALPDSCGGGELQFYAFFEYRRKYRDEYSFYARKDRPGCAFFSRRSIPSPAPSSDDNTDSLRIAFPHWGPNYVWRSDKQEELALKLLSEGYDMVLGHGAHSLQEIHCFDGRWVAYSIGNGNFQSPGRWAQYSADNGILPFGFWTMVEVHRDYIGNRRIFSKFYPVYLDNKITNFQPRPVNKSDFMLVENVLYYRRKSAPVKLDSKEDELGHFLEIDHGKWADRGRLAENTPAPW